MAPKKVNLQWISKESTRQAMFKKRQASLMKKAIDTATLCGTKACVVVYGEGKSQPEVWPSVPEARQLLNSFKGMPDYLENYKRRSNQEDFLRNRISHLHYQLNNSDRENCERENLFLLHKTMAGHHPSLVGLPNADLTRLKCMVETKIQKIMERLQQLDIEEGQTLQKPPVQPMLFSSQQQADHIYTVIEAPLPTKEPQLEQHDFLLDQTENRGD